MSYPTTPASIVKTEVSASNIKRKQRDLWLRTLIILGLAVAIIWLINGGLRVIGSLDPFVLWLIVIALMVTFLFAIGYATNGQLLGALIDSTNHMTLSRLQITLWTILTLSSYLLIAMPRLLGGLVSIDRLPANDLKLSNCRLLLKKDVVTVAECGGGPLEITFPQELVIAMGISAVSFAGSSLIQSNKKNKVVDIQSRDASVREVQKKRDDAERAKKDADAELKAARGKKDERKNDLDGAEDPKVKAVFQTRFDSAAAAFESAAAKQKSAESDLTDADAALKKAQDDFKAAQVEAEGLLHKNADSSQASLLDLFRGGEVGNYTLIDMGKVQMFFFTIVVIMAYAIAVIALLRDQVALTNPLGVDFPPFSNSLNTLLGISHAAYLSNKTIDHTRTL